MAEKKNKQKNISARMHYATLGALMIANLCTLGLAMLFANVVGISMGNVAVVGGQWQVEKTYARALKTTASATTVSSLELQNAFNRSWTNSYGTFYQFKVSIRNNGTLGINKLALQYAFDRSIFEYIPSNDPRLQVTAEKVSGLQRFFGVQTALASPSIDFPCPDCGTTTRFMLCSLDTTRDPATCNWTSGRYVLLPGQTWSTPVVLRRISAVTLENKQSFLGNIFSWFVGIFPAKASPSIDFPGGGPSIDFPSGGPSIDFPTDFITHTTATIIKAVNVRGVSLRNLPSVTTSIVIPF